ncbi:hypothetical protein DFQ27_006226 [Actinomortierella ambigua]|uniref:Uncharacterized protein n=1 Tax=Actinomortierella ambigua TaxID=1343610 RepID=A0A9P6PWF3_9FUNG|nr:hypothetical protein DFQ27_006226 [Actinomortierella ambigua]
MRSYALSCLVVVVASLMSSAVAAPASVEVDKLNCTECRDIYIKTVRWCGGIVPPDLVCLSNAKKAYDQCRIDSGCL